MEQTRTSRSEVGASVLSALDAGREHFDTARQALLDMRDAELDVLGYAQEQRQAKAALESASLTARLAAPRDGRNAEERALQTAAYLASDHAVVEAYAAVDRATVALAAAESRVKLLGLTIGLARDAMRLCTAALFAASGCGS